MIVIKKFNSFWPVYKNFEEEILELSKYINFSDDQLNVYSMHISDLIVRIAIEIEALSKELYKDNGGTKVFDDKGKEREPFFDTECIQFLDDNWRICNREIMVSCANFYFSNQENRVFKPLHKAKKRGSSGAVWNKSYQAVKHDRRTDIKKENIKALIHALGALYILNIYYRNESLDYGTFQEPNKFFDSRLGSLIFSATFADATKASINGNTSKVSIPDSEKNKLDTALCIIKYTDMSWKKMNSEFNNLNSKIIQSIIEQPEFLSKVNEIYCKKSEIPKDDIMSILTNLGSKYIDQNPKMTYILGKAMITGEKEVIVNKNQDIY